MHSTAMETWENPPGFPSLIPGVVQLWLIECPQLADFRQLERLLGPEEHRRADQFARADLRARYIETHGLLRILLSRYMSRPPAGIEIETDALGKPRLSGDTLHFNLAHTGGRLLFAFCRDHPVGVDIERVRPLDDFLTIAHRMFASEEYNALQDTPEAQRQEAFIACWTRKEAYVKARGIGLRLSLESFAVPTGPLAEPVTPVNPPGDPPWYLLRLPPHAGYQLAVAASAAIPTRCWRIGRLDPFPWCDTAPPTAANQRRNKKHNP